MWHKPCRTFHPWCLCIKTHCLVIPLMIPGKQFMQECSGHGPLARYVKLRVAHAPGMPERFPRHRLQTKPLVSDPGMHHGTCVTYVPWCISGSLNPQWRGKTFPAFPAHAQPASSRIWQEAHSVTTPACIAGEGRCSVPLLCYLQSCISRYMVVLPCPSTCTYTCVSVATYHTYFWHTLQ